MKESKCELMQSDKSTEVVGATTLVRSRSLADDEYSLQLRGTGLRVDGKALTYDDLPPALDLSQLLSQHERDENWQRKHSISSIKGSVNQVKQALELEKQLAQQETTVVKKKSKKSASVGASPKIDVVVKKKKVVSSNSIHETSDNSLNSVNGSASVNGDSPANSPIASPSRPRRVKKPVVPVPVVPVTDSTTLSPSSIESLRQPAVKKTPLKKSKSETSVEDAKKSKPRRKSSAIRNDVSSEQSPSEQSADVIESFREQMIQTSKNSPKFSKRSKSVDESASSPMPTITTQRNTTTTTSVSVSTHPVSKAKVTTTNTLTSTSTVREVLTVAEMRLAARQAAAASQNASTTTASTAATTPNTSDSISPPPLILVHNTSSSSLAASLPQSRRVQTGIDIGKKPVVRVQSMQPSSSQQTGLSLLNEEDKHVATWKSDRSSGRKRTKSSSLDLDVESAQKRLEEHLRVSPPIHRPGVVPFRPKLASDSAAETQQKPQRVGKSVSVDFDSNQRIRRSDSKRLHSSPDNLMTAVANAINEVEQATSDIHEDSYYAVRKQRPEQKSVQAQASSSSMSSRKSPAEPASTPGLAARLLQSFKFHKSTSSLNNDTSKGR